MDERDSAEAVAAAAKAYAHVGSARKNLIGRRLALSGTHRDVQQALLDLRAAHRELGKAIELVEKWEGRD